MPTNLPMFNTWKYGPEGKVENLKTSHDYETARSSQHQACNRCHEKKVSCFRKELFWELLVLRLPVTYYGNAVIPIGFISISWKGIRLGACMAS